MKPSREEVLRIAKECGVETPAPGDLLATVRLRDFLERFTTAMYEAGAAECGKLLAEQDADYNRKTNALIDRHSKRLEDAVAVERAVSDKLLEALNSVYLSDRTSMAFVNSIIAEVEAMRKENKE